MIVSLCSPAVTQGFDFGLSRVHTEGPKAISVVKPMLSKDQIQK